MPSSALLALLLLLQLLSGRHRPFARADLFPSPELLDRTWTDKGDARWCDANETEHGGLCQREADREFLCDGDPSDGDETALDAFFDSIPRSADPVRATALRVMQRCSRRLRGCCCAQSPRRMRTTTRGPR